MAPTDDVIKDFDEHGNKWLWPVNVEALSRFLAWVIEESYGNRSVDLTEEFKPRVARIRSVGGDVRYVTGIKILQTGMINILKTVYIDGWAEQ